jgi:N-acyl-L-homoserine lactone synthetase
MSGDGERHLQDLDVAAARLVASLGPISVGRAADGAELDQCARMRLETGVAMGWVRPEDHPDGREADEHDAAAVHLVCREGGRVVGCVRIVAPGADGLLPLERELGVRVPVTGRTAELGRLATLPERRGAAGLAAVAGLMAAGWLEARALGFGDVAGAATPATLALYRALGMRLVELGPPGAGAGEARVPFLVTGAEPALLRHGVGAPGASRPAALTRRRLLAGTAAAAAGGLVVLGLPGAGAAQARPRLVGTGPTDRTTLGVIARIDQEGRDLVATGHLVRLLGLPLASLFTRAPGTISTDPAAADVSLARFTIVVRARIAAITVMGPAITAVGTGTAAIHLLPAGGARAGDPASFAAGRAVAAFDVDFQNDLALDGPDNATASLHADMAQRRARAFALGGRRLRIGSAGLLWSLRASGRGVRSEPTIPRSTIFVSGGMALADARAAP